MSRIDYDLKPDIYINKLFNNLDKRLFEKKYQLNIYRNYLNIQFVIIHLYSSFTFCYNIIRSFLYNCFNECSLICL